jgi:hypothetical protein
MDLTQKRLTKAEWNSIEIDVSPEEKFILNIIINGFNNIMIYDNTNLSLLDFLKIHPTDQIHKYIYQKYLAPRLEPILKKHNVSYEKISIKKKEKLKKADLFRFENTDRLLEGEVLFEFVLIDLIEKMLKAKHKNKKTWLESYYTLVFLNDYKINNTNPHLKSILMSLLNTVNDTGNENISYIIQNAYTIIEKNDYLLKYADVELYDHQKQLFQTYNAKTEEDFSNKSPTMTLYIAPTATGKTLSPLGLSESYKIIFVCAARHVGLALARSAISKHKKVAFAFGCNDAEDIRLHYFAAKECIRNRRTGQIAKVDNSVGDKVEIMICDIKSYIIAMYYMLAFNPKNKIIMYWDEPTISMDYDEHDLHDLIRATWVENIIPNIILSSATLPKEEEIIDTIADYKNKFPTGQVKSIISHDSKKTIPLINKDGQVEMPHYVSRDYNVIQKAAAHCLDYLTILRYLDLGEAVKFIIYMNTQQLKRRYTIENYFENVNEVTMKSLKIYYLKLLKNITENNWLSIYEHFISQRTPVYNSTIYITTRDSHTLTDGPTLFLADDIHKIARACIQMSQIPKQVLSDISDAIIQNNLINTKIDEMERALEAGTSLAGESVHASGRGHSADMSRSSRRNKEKGTSENMSAEMRGLHEKIQDARNLIKTVALHDMFVPNRKNHLEKWCANHDNCSFCKDAFTCNIQEAIVEEIMLINDVEDSWKILLLMGIGVFASEHSSRYMEVMKKLADEQKLFVIIASSDYIYGTNYQFCHGYLSKDLSNMSQEKCIQALGRIGRNKLQHSYSLRFRDSELIEKLFKSIPITEKPEVTNMNRLFNAQEV